MKKQSFTYRDRKIAMSWIVIMGIILVWFIPEILNSLNGILYYATNIVLTIGIVFVLWRCVNKFPGVTRTGYFWKENGVTQLEYAGKFVNLNHVTELFLSDKNSFTQGIFLRIVNNGENTVFLSDPVEKCVEDSVMYTIFAQVLAENQMMVQEKDIHGNPIKYWYKGQH